MPETTLSLPVGCCAPRPWLWVLQGDKQVLVSAERSAQPGSMRAASPILSPQSATGVQGKGGGGQGAPPPWIFPIHGGSACHPEWSPLQSAGLGVWGIAVRAPQDLGAVSRVLASVAGTSHSVLPWQAALKGGGGHLFFPFCWMSLSPRPREERLSRAGRGPGPGKRRDPLSTPFSLA